MSLSNRMKRLRQLLAIPRLNKAMVIITIGIHITNNSEKTDIGE